MMMDTRLSKPKKVEASADRKGRIFKNSCTSLQEPHQKAFYRSMSDFRESGTDVEGARNFAHNICTYSNLKKTKNTIDMV